jgi:hypothetical protein
MRMRGPLARIKAEDWLGLGLELVVVIVGIALAFQVDRAYQASQDRQLEFRYLERLHADLVRDTAELSAVVRRTGSRIEQVDLLDAASKDPTVAAVRPAEFVRAMEQVTWRSVPVIHANTYRELESTGRMILLRSEALRDGLADYYSFIDEQRRLGLGEDDQDRYRLETLGLLSAPRLAGIEDPERYPGEATPAEAERIAVEYAGRPDAHVWLPRLTKYQVLMRRLAEEFRVRAEALLFEIDGELGPRPERTPES